MSNNEHETATLEQAIDEMPQRGPDALPAIERRIAELKQQREQANQQALMQDAAYAGAIQTLEALQKELAGEGEA